MSELQRKVTVLQQRHRRHLDKLLGLESTVSQLRQDNLLHEERLQLLEKVGTGHGARSGQKGDGARPGDGMRQPKNCDRPLMTCSFPLNFQE